MSKVRVRKETGKLYLDFMFAGHRCREQTALVDTPANRKKAEALLLRIPASVTGHSGHRDRFAHGHRAGVGFVL